MNVITFQLILKESCCLSEICTVPIISAFQSINPSVSHRNIFNSLFHICISVNVCFDYSQTVYIWNDFPTCYTVVSLNHPGCIWSLSHKLQLSSLSLKNKHVSLVYRTATRKHSLSLWSITCPECFRHTHYAKYLTFAGAINLNEWSVRFRSLNCPSSKLRASLLDLNNWKHEMSAVEGNLGDWRRARLNYWILI